MQSKTRLPTICKSIDYQLGWGWLRSKGRIAKTLSERKAHLTELLEGDGTEG